MILVMISLFVINFQATVRTNDEYSFKIEKFRVIEKKETTIGATVSDGHYLAKLCDPQRIDLCKAAKKFALLDGTVSQIPEETFPALYSVSYAGRETREDNVTAILCETIPRSYLCLIGHSNTDITILLKENKFETDSRYTFHLEIVESVTKANTDENVEENRLVSLSPVDRLDLCVAAKKRVQSEVLPELLDSQVEEPTIFEIRYPKILLESHRVKLLDNLFSKIKRAAFACPSSPVMYLYFGRFVHQVRVMLVKKSHAA